jgi:hypothetical protein
MEKATDEGKVDYVYQWIQKRTNWIPEDSDNPVDKEHIQTLIAMMTVQIINDWGIVRAAEAGEPYLYGTGGRKKPEYMANVNKDLRKQYAL